MIGSPKKAIVILFSFDERGRRRHDATDAGSYDNTLKTSELARQPLYIKENSMRGLIVPVAVVLLASKFVMAQSSPSYTNPGITYPGSTPNFPVAVPATGFNWSVQGQLSETPGVWLGGDSGLCCPLNSTHSLWTFCDAAIGPVGSTSRAQAKVGVEIGNTLAIVDASGGTFNPTHYFRGTPTAPQAFFLDPDNINSSETGPRIWLRKATLVQTTPTTSTLYLFGVQYKDSVGLTNNYIIRVNNPSNDPTQWLYEYLRIAVNPNVPPPPTTTLGPTVPTPLVIGMEAFADGDYLYTYGAYTPPSSGIVGFNATSFWVVGLRIPFSALNSYNVPGSTGYPGTSDDISPAVQYLTTVNVDGSGDPHWELNTSWTTLGSYSQGLLAPAQPFCLTIGFPNGSSMNVPAYQSFSLRYNPSISGCQLIWGNDVAIFNYLNQKTPGPNGDTNDYPYLLGYFGATGIKPYGRFTSPTATGFINFFTEMVNNSQTQDQTYGGFVYNYDNFCYFVREVPAFESSNNNLLMTYTTGSFQQVTGGSNQGQQSYDRFVMDNALYTVESTSVSNPLVGSGGQQSAMRSALMPKTAKRSGKVTPQIKVQPKSGKVVRQVKVQPD